MLTGALVGAQVGLEGIPRRFITGLRDAQCYLALAAELEQWAIRQENALTQDGVGVWQVRLKTSHCPPKKPAKGLL